MIDQMSQQGIPHRKDTSNFHYAGMYLTLIATIFFLFEFLITLGLALDVMAGEWVWEVAWEVILALIILIGGFASVILAYKRRGYPTVITVMTLMLAMSLLNMFRLYEWLTLTMITFVVCLIALVKLSIGHNEFITPRQKREGKAIREKADEPQTRQARPGYREEIYEPERPRVRQQPASTREAKQAPARTQQTTRAANVQKAAQTRRAPQTPAQPRARSKPQSNTGTKSFKVRNCGKCAEMIPRDEAFCPFCGDDSYRNELIRKVEIAYESGVISKEQYLNNLKKFAK